MRKRTQAREVILTILYQWDISKIDIEILLKEYCDSQNVEDPEIKNYAKRVLRGTFEKKF